MTNPGTINIVLNLLTLLMGGTLVGVFLRYRLGLKKLASGDVADIRDHYAKEVSALRAKLNDQEGHFRSMEKHWREMLENSDRRHEECEKARAELRAELEDLHSEIRGLRDQIRRYSADTLLILEGATGLPSIKAPEAVASAERVKRITEGDK